MLNNVTLSRNNFEHFPTGPPKQFASVQVQDHIVVVIYEGVSLRFSMVTAIKHSVILLFYNIIIRCSCTCRCCKDCLSTSLQIIKPALLAPHHKEHFTGETSMPQQCTKKFLSNSLGLVDFAIGLVNSVLNLPDGQVKYFAEFNSQKNYEINSAPKKMLGAR